MNPVSNKTRNSALALVTLAAFTPGAARAATLVWAGTAGDLSFDIAANWGGTLPGPADIAQFRENGYADGDTITVSSDLLLGRLAINYSSTNAAAKNLTINGAPITLNGTASPLVGINRQNTVAGVQTINNSLVLAASQQWNVSGNADAPTGLGRLVINGVISETAGGPKEFTKNGNTNLELNGDDTFTGQTTIIQNTVILGHAKALGLGTSPVLVGNTAVNTSQSNLLTKGSVTFARDVFVRSGQTGGTRLGGADGVGVTTWTGTLSLNKDVSLTGGLGAATGIADFRGNIVDATDPNNAFVSSNVTKINGGTVKLSGLANTYSGSTAVNAGTLLVNGKLSASDALATVATGGRLGGVGEIDRPVSVSTGGILSPGDAGPGTLTVGAGTTLTLSDGAVVEWQAGASPATSDRIDAAAITLGATPTLKILPGAASPDASASYVLLNWSGDDPAALPDWTVDASAGFTGHVDYVGAGDGLPGGQVVLSNVAAAAAPEPALVSLAPLAVAWVTARRRRR